MYLHEPNSQLLLLMLLWPIFAFRDTGFHFPFYQKLTPVENAFAASKLLPPVFVLKTYDMVDNPATDPIIKWCSGNKSFIVSDLPEFENILLPAYFKHNNFSSFTRQLDAYGFHKINRKRYEYAHPSFLRGEKEKLALIVRRNWQMGSSSGGTTDGQGTSQKGGSSGSPQAEDDWELELANRKQEQLHLEHQVQVKSMWMEEIERKSNQIEQMMDIVFGPDWNREKGTNLGDGSTAVEDKDFY